MEVKPHTLLSSATEVSGQLPEPHNETPVNSGIRAGLNLVVRRNILPLLGIKPLVIWSRGSHFTD
jgi:hypothetical protein